MWDNMSKKEGVGIVLHIPTPFSIDLPHFRMPIDTEGSKNGDEKWISQRKLLWEIFYKLFPTCEKSRMDENGFRGKRNGGVNKKLKVTPKCISALAGGSAFRFVQVQHYGLKTAI